MTLHRSHMFSTIIHQWKQLFRYRKFSSELRTNEINVVIVDKFWNYYEKKTTLKSIKTQFSLHYRDIIALGMSFDDTHLLQMKYTRRKISPVLLPRHTCVLASLGNIKAILLSDKTLVFDPHLPAVQAWIHRLVKTQRSENQDFELQILEELFKEICDNFDRRIALYNTLLHNATLDGSENFGIQSNGKRLSWLQKLMWNGSNRSNSSDDVIYKLSPLADLLYEFELELKEAQSSLENILDNDEDMAGMLLTARSNATAKDLKFDISMHEDAELLLENYALRLSSSLHDVMHLQHKIKSKQDLADLSMKIRRNRLLWLNASLAASAVCVSVCSAVFSAFGMNLLSGLEEQEHIFYALTGGSVGASLIVFYRLLRYMRGDSPESAEQLQVAERRVLESVFSDSHTIDVLLNFAHQRVNEPGSAGKLTKSEFAELFASIKGTKEISDDEVNAVFDLFDKNYDGMWYKNDLNKLNEGLEYSVSYDKRRKK